MWVKDFRTDAQVTEGKMRTLSLSLLTCAFILAPTMAHAGANAGAVAYLSWKGQTSTDLPSPAPEAEPVAPAPKRRRRATSRPVGPPAE